MNIKDFDNIKLCDIIICNRYLNLFKDLSIECMEELSFRRQNGEQFNFEEYIENNSKELPNLNFDIKKIQSIALNFSKGLK